MKTRIALFATVLLSACTSKDTGEIAGNVLQAECGQELCASQIKFEQRASTRMYAGMPRMNEKTQHLILTTGKAPVSVTSVDFDARYAQAFKVEEFSLALDSPVSEFMQGSGSWRGQSKVILSEIPGIRSFELDHPMALSANTSYEFDLWLPVYDDAYNGLYGTEFHTIVVGFGTASEFHTCPLRQRDNCQLVGGNIIFKKE